MFPRGARFPTAKIPDVPGPNAYNPQDPEYDAYKRGAFLEKTNRFAKEKPSEVPGPGTYNSESTAAQTKSTGHSTKSVGDRYAHLQRKLEELEKLYAEGKKSHHLEVERLKLDLSRVQKSSADHAERADKLKKQNEALEARIQELKKMNSSEQSELRELRIKLKAAEHERAQLTAKQGEAGETKKALQAAEARRKDDQRERDRKIAELERAFDQERKKREAAESRLAETRSKVDGELQEAHAAAASLQAQLDSARSGAQTAIAALEDLKGEMADREEELLERLDQHREVLSRVAEEYGRLAMMSVSKVKYIQAEDEANLLRLRVYRLERKLANTEGQVVELANLVRFAKEENAFLTDRVRESGAEVEYYVQCCQDLEAQNTIVPSSLDDVEHTARIVAEEMHEMQLEAGTGVAQNLAVWDTFHRLKSELLLQNCTVLLSGWTNAESTLEVLGRQLIDADVKHKELVQALEAQKVEHVSTQQHLVEASAALDICKGSEAALKSQLEGAKTQHTAEVTRLQQAVQKERKATRRLAEILQKSRMSEEARQAEVEQLLSELSEAEKYQEAYNNLLEEVDGLVARNALAEEEAARLSKFNAEIIGHNNPAQRIMYVDRIRRELHDTKQKLLASNRDRDVVQAYNEDLEHELALYKSVGVPPEMKPRTMLTRVERASTLAQSAAANGGSVAAERGKLKFLSEAEHGEMTLDEIM